MGRDIRFRAWSKGEMHYGGFSVHASKGKPECMPGIGPDPEDMVIEQFTGIKDSEGSDIFEGDVLEFSDKWEWYRTKYSIPMMAADAEELKALKSEYDAEPMERRAIEIPSDYEWLLSSEIQSWWTVIGNIHENPELLDAP